MEETVVAEIMRPPCAPLILEALQQACAEEQERRQRFYAEMAEEQKTEFIRGEVIVHSPAQKRPVDATLHAAQLLKTYSHKHDLGYVGAEKVLVRLSRNDYEPDVCFFGREKAAALRADQLFFPAPDLVVEVLSDGTEHRDRGIKFEDYQLHGVAKYWIVDAQHETVEQYYLRAQRYELLVKAREGSLTSQVVTGLTFPIPVLFDESALMTLYNQNAR